MSAIVQLSKVTVRFDESKILSHKLLVNGAAENLTGWTIELYLDGTKKKTVTTSSDPADQGRILNQSTNPGEYYFTITAANSAELLGSNRTREVLAYVKYISTDTSPPRIFSNVEFTFAIVSGRSW